MDTLFGIALAQKLGQTAIMQEPSQCLAFEDSNVHKPDLQDEFYIRILRKDAVPDR